MNGVGASLWLTSVEPGQEETEIHHWESSGLKIYNINPQDINTVSFYLDVYNELDYDVIPRHDFVDDDFVVYPKGEENATEPKHETQPTDLVLADNDACTLMIVDLTPMAWTVTRLKLTSKTKQIKKSCLPLEVEVP